MPETRYTIDMLLGLEPPPCRICGEKGELHEFREHALLPSRGFLNDTFYRMICTFCGSWTEDTDNKRRALYDWARGRLLPPAYEDIPP